MVVYKEDFDNERRDKERAFSERDSLLKQTTNLQNEVKVLRERVCTDLLVSLYPVLR